MYSTHPISSHLLFCLCLLVLTSAPIASAAAAEESSATAGRRLIEDESGLMVTLPRVERSAVAARLEELRERLQRRLERLARLREAQGFRPRDALITLVMPGGLLYAAYRRHQFEQASRAFESSRSRLTDLTEESRALRNETPLDTRRIAALP